jgi:hypothetical protein
LSSRFRFSLAGPEDDADLRALMAAGRMEGDIAVSFRREPSYFAGCCVQGDHAAVIKCVEVETGRVIGHGCRSTLEAFVAGAPRRIGYLSDLRSVADYRRGTLLARGYRFLRELHEGDPVPFYYTVIYDGNALAMANLVGARAGLPAYVDQGRVLTPALQLGFRKRELTLAGVRVVAGESARLEAIVEFLNREQRDRPLAPVRYPAQFTPGGRYSGLAAGDFLLAENSTGEILGTIAIWDQRDIRQTHVERYSRRLAIVKPVYNLAARALPFRPLPSVGARVPNVYLCCVAARGHDVAIFRLLLRAAYNRLRASSAHYAIVGLHERDPFVVEIEDYKRIPAAGRLFLVHYPEVPLPNFGGRVPSVEAACF